MVCGVSVCWSDPTNKFFTKFFQFFPDPRRDTKGYEVSQYLFEDNLDVIPK
jgi:hypothetical protein